jgi:RNA-directed DNA polymerase
MCRTRTQVLESIMKKLDLEINIEKSKLVNLWDDINGFDFLGLHYRKFPAMNNVDFLFE